MNFFNPATTQSATPGAATTGFTAGMTGGGDANKTLPTTFSLPGAQPQAKPGGIFPTGLTNTPAPAFGATPAAFTGTPAAPASGFNFGGTSTPNTGLSFVPKSTPTPATTKFTLGTPAASIAGTAQPLTFGTPATSTPATTGFTLGGSTPATGGLTFGLAASTPAATPATPATPGLTRVTPASSAAPAFALTTTTSAPAASTPFSLGTVAPATTSSLGFSLPGITSTASTGFSLSSTAPTLATSFSLGKTTAPTSTAAVTSTSTQQVSLGSITTVTSSTGAAATGGMNFCQLEEAINKWTLELEEQEKSFVNQATQVNSWDKLLIANGEKIVTLNEEIERVKTEQLQLEQELDYVVGQQKELQDCLVPLEKEMASISVSDPEREYTYNLAENLDTQLKQMSEDLKEIIEHLNEANRAQDSSDPIVQIGKILNAHMNSLQWLDQRTEILGQKIQQIDQMHQNFRKENERSFNLAYN
ncbi:nuclear pore glycoprotein p62 [Fopius arisanus]|uniref:Nuclear pore glycoprotein p62 n=1 Tax=Fopius arisanus TaxID=64838 RepID=A0A0C9QMH9_9HYME|nr:PREDICTED: nuclear pore glycoprotein p62 [Fopius arisanus]